jgi:hypothetical protein
MTPGVRPKPAARVEIAMLNDIFSAIFGNKFKPDEITYRLGK